MKKRLTNSQIVLRSIDIAERTEYSSDEIVEKFNEVFNLNYKREDIIRDMMVGNYVGNISYIVYQLVLDLRNKTANNEDTEENIEKFLSIL